MQSRVKNSYLELEFMFGFTITWETNNLPVLKFSFKFSEIIPTKLDAFWRDNEPFVFFLIQIEHTKNKNHRSIDFF